MSKYREFEEVDPFNPQNTVAGTISISDMDSGYGAITIHSVNGVTGLKHQKIPATPKIHYPEYVSTEGKSNKFFHSHEKEIYDIEAYEKVDGTNIFGFVYHDAQGEEFVSYKTRLRPFVSNSFYGNFLDLFRGIKPAHLDDYILNSGYNISMELWGNENPHLIHYPNVKLQLTLLFGRERKYNSYVVPPNHLPSGHNLHVPNVKSEMQWPITVSQKWWTYERLKNFYTSAQEDIEKDLVPYSDGEEGAATQFIGQEGCIIYVQEYVGPSGRRKVGGYWTPYKLKPHSIEEIHWAAGSDDGIRTETLRSTCFKAMEAFDFPTVENVIELLQEDWGEVAIGIALPRVGVVLGEVMEEISFRNKVWEVYNSISFDGDNTDKRTVMRALSHHFDKKDMTKVYSQVRQVFTNDS